MRYDHFLLFLAHNNMKASDMQGQAEKARIEQFEAMRNDPRIGKILGGLPNHLKNSVSFNGKR